MTPMERIEGELSDAQKRIAELEYLLARQAKAAQQGMDAAKKVAGSNLEQAKRLHAECNPEALESERAANALLTERIAELEEREAAMAAQFVAMQDAATDLIHASSEEEAGDAMERIAGCGEKQARDILARHGAVMQVEAMRHVANWLSGAIEEDCIGLDLGGEISGPTGCRDADKCRVAGERVFREAARIWEYKFVRGRQ